jgi:hypothetical protein
VTLTAGADESEADVQADSIISSASSGAQIDMAAPVCCLARRMSGAYRSRRHDGSSWLVMLFHARPRLDTTACFMILWQGDRVATPRPGSSGRQTSVDDQAGIDVAVVLVERGVVRVPGRWPDSATAWRAALRVTAAARGLDLLCAGLPDLDVVGEFTAPPPGVVQREFQALHFDFGIPRLAAPVAASRFTALFLDGQCVGSGAATRIVPLGRLLRQRHWPARAVLAERLCRDARDGAAVEGILARIIEAADQSSDLPDKNEDGFLCGMEFSTLHDEYAYFARHGLQLAAVEKEFVLSPGELLLFDNLTAAHGRRGRRNTGELHQLCIGFASLDLAGQATLLDRILASFGAASGSQEAVLADSGT